jgi:hypothetical protein
MFNTVTTGNIYRSYSSAAISVFLPADGEAYIGGIAGGASTGSSIWVEECYASGNISLDGAADAFAVGGLVGGQMATHTPGPLFFSRSVAMMGAINILSGSAGNWGMISGDTETYDPTIPWAPAPIPDSAYTAPLPMRYYASDISYIGPSPTPLQNASIPRANLVDDRFFEPILSGGMNWDSNQTWKWDLARGRPVFQWE